MKVTHCEKGLLARMIFRSSQAVVLLQVAIVFNGGRFSLRTSCIPLSGDV